jgi:hypothetical protein
MLGGNSTSFRADVLPLIAGIKESEGIDFESLKRELSSKTG